MIKIFKQDEARFICPEVPDFPAIVSTRLPDDTPVVAFEGNALEAVDLTPEHAQAVGRALIEAGVYCTTMGPGVEVTQEPQREGVASAD